MGVLVVGPEIHLEQHLPDGMSPARIWPVVGLEEQHLIKRDAKPTLAASSRTTIPSFLGQDNFLVLFIGAVNRRTPKTHKIHDLECREEEEGVTNTEYL